MAMRVGGLGFALLFVACAPSSEEPRPLEIEEVEVAEPVDVGLSTEGDEKQRAPSGGEGWILSGMLPEDLPLHRPARLVGSGDTPEGRKYFVFHTATGADAVRAGLTRAMAGAGWSASATGDGLSVVKGGERVDFFFSPLRPGTEIRVVY